MVDQRALLSHDAIGLSELVRAGTVSAAELLDATISRIEALDGQINAVVDRAFDRARESIDRVPEDGPFAGVPTFVKDLVDVEGLRRTEGSRLRAEHRSDASPDYVMALERSGLVIAGKTNTSEFASLPVTDNELFGLTRNPWSPDHSPGGSSGGSAAAVAAGYTPIAHGTDGGGSNRIPASACGVFGMKASRGRQQSGELDGTDPVFKTHHAITRSVRDSAALLAVTERRSGGPFDPIGRVTDPIDRPLRIGVSRADVLGRAPDAAASDALESSISLLSELGHEVVEVAVPVDGEMFFEAYRNLFLSRTVGLLDLIEAQAGVPVEQTGLLTTNTIGLMRLGDELPPDAGARADAYRVAMTRSLADFFEPIDMWMSLVIPFATVAIDEFDPSAPFDSGHAERYLSSAPVANMAGLPSMSVPLWFDAPSGVPIGTMFTGAAGDDGLLYRLAFQLEAARPWFERWAPGSAMFL